MASLAVQAGAIGGALAGSILGGLPDGGRIVDRGQLVSARVADQRQHLTAPNGDTYATATRPTGDLIVAWRASGADSVVSASSLLACVDRSATPTPQVRSMRSPRPGSTTGPNGTTAITCNLAVVETTDAGYLTLNPGGTTNVGAASINWYTNAQTLDNGTVAAIAADRTVTVIAVGGGTTRFIIDITGHYR